MYVCVCVCMFGHSSGTHGAISTKLGTHMALSTCKNLMYIFYIYYLLGIIFSIHTVICVPSLVEIAPGVPELCWYNRSCVDQNLIFQN
jgi:hypothetical protein